VTRRSGQGFLLTLLLGVPVLALAPFDLGTVRLAGVNLLWWYGGVAAPVAAALIALAALRPRR
jgi:hypothetical protein